MNRRDLDFVIPLTREQWEQLGHSANARPDFGVFRWAPAEFDTIHVAMREGDVPAGWAPAVPPADARVSDREVARFRWNDGRPYAEVDFPDAPLPPAVTADERQRMERNLELWVRARWHTLMRDSGIHYDSGALPADEPNPPHRTP